MTILAVCDTFPSHMVISICDEVGILIDSIYMNKPWTQEDIDADLGKISLYYGIERWISSGERKMIERSEMIRR
ncbi:MAG: hypothetical protein M0R80_03695 [Proteobacteria bacterium]|nr:hypothetical protein [Pseudomonadota bacterium]